MRLVRGALLVLALFLPSAGAFCCVPDPADACCSEETACPLGTAADCLLTHATPAANLALERDLGQVPTLLPTGLDFAGTPPLLGPVPAGRARSVRGPGEFQRNYPLRN